MIQMPALSRLYDSEFYRGQRGSSFDAASAILPVVVGLVAPHSIVDVGCGAGTWLAAAERLGVQRLVGLEGSWVSATDLLSPAIRLVTHDLEQPIRLQEEFDLAMSLEVAEHVSERRADALVSELCSLAPCILFGAAIPGQGGVNHVNEQWQSYWARKFAAHDYRPLDIIRPAFWQRDEIPVHYRQNTLLYACADKFDALMARHGDERAPAWALDIVHPAVHLSNYEALVAPMSIGQSLRAVAALPRAVGRSIRSRFARARGARG